MVQRLWSSHTPEDVGSVGGTCCPRWRIVFAKVVLGLKVPRRGLEAVVHSGDRGHYQPQAYDRHVEVHPPTSSGRCYVRRLPWPCPSVGLLEQVPGDLQPWVLPAANAQRGASDRRLGAGNAHDRYVLHQAVHAGYWTTAFIRQAPRWRIICAKMVLGLKVARRELEAVHSGGLAGPGTWRSSIVGVTCRPCPARSIRSQAWGW